MTAPAPTTPQEEAEREHVDTSAEMVQIAADGVKLGKMIGRTDTLADIIHRVTAALEATDYAHPDKPWAWREGYRAGLQRVGAFLAQLAAEETP